MRSVALLAAIGIGGCEATDATCEAGAPTLGEAGGFGVDALALTWSRDARTGAYVARSVTAIVPDDVVGLALTVDAGIARTALSKVTLGGEVLLDAFGGNAGLRRVTDTASVGTGDTASAGGAPGWWVAPFFHGPGQPGSLTMPVDPGSRPFGGCLVVEAVALDAPSGGTLRLATKRSPVDAHTLDIDLVVVDGAGITDAQLGSAVGVMSDLFVAGGALTVGDVTSWSVTLPEGPFLGSSNAALAPLRATHLEGARPWSLRFFFLADFQGDAGTLGIASGIPGAIGVPDTAGSGVALSVRSHLDDRGRLDVQTLGETMAHEGGHQLGLFHTTEAEGTSFDPLDDTPACDARHHDVDGDGVVSAEECADADGRNVMFWVSGSFRQDQLSPDQADVLDRSPIAVRAQEER